MLVPRFLSSALGSELAVILMEESSEKNQVIPTTTVFLWAAKASAVLMTAKSSVNKAALPIKLGGSNLFCHYE